MGQQDGFKDGDYVQRGVFHDMEEHSTHTRVSTPDAISKSLRRHYPYHTVTLTPGVTEIIQFALAGQADAKLETTKGTILRTHKPAKGRSTEDSGMLTDKVKMGRYDYHWKNKDFIIYTLEYSANMRAKELACLLYKHEENDVVDGRSRAADELIAAASNYASEPHDEVFVFDQLVWTKNPELWKSVQQSSWDDVILETEMKDALTKDVEGFFDCEHEYKEFAVPWKVSL